MKPHCGFSLVEIVVSIAILGTILILLQATITSSVLVRDAKNQGIALSIARNKIESLRLGGYAALPVTGSFSDNLLSSLPQATTTLTVNVYNDKTKQVTVKVIWKDARLSASSTVSLSTLITETGGLP
jgi:prepilin-type N-terminal cleavage/methylation domain-containing protein